MVSRTAWGGGQFIRRVAGDRLRSRCARSSTAPVRRTSRESTRIMSPARPFTFRLDSPRGGRIAQPPAARGHAVSNQARFAR